MSEFKKIFHKVGGWNVIKQYAKAHVLFFALLEGIILGASKKSLEILRLAVSNKILSKLRKKNRKVIRQYLEENNMGMGEKRHSDIIWICWLQGIENAPEIVKLCYKSIEEHFPDKEIRVLTEKNYKEYVQFPAYIMEKLEKGIITKTHFSDLLRLEVLIKYGGTWMDATVLCTGGKIYDYMFESDLFLYQCLKPGRDGHASVISSWFMTACANNPVLLLTKHLLYQYWERKNYMIDYYLLHDCFQLALETYPEEWEKIMPVSNSTPHILLLHLFDKYDKEWFYNVTEQSCLHKLSYKFTEEEKNRADTYYTYLLNDFVG